MSGVFQITKPFVRRFKPVKNIQRYFRRNDAVIPRNYEQNGFLDTARQFCVVNRSAVSRIPQVNPLTHPVRINVDINVGQYFTEKAASSLRLCAWV